MIIKTTMDWSKPREMTEQEKELVEAKKEFMSDYVPDEVYETVPRPTLIDTTDNKVYVETEPGRICMKPLFMYEYFESEHGLQKVEERLYFNSTLDELYEQLTIK